MFRKRVKRMENKFGILRKKDSEKPEEKKNEKATVKAAAKVTAKVTARARTEAKAKQKPQIEAKAEANAAAKNAAKAATKAKAPVTGQISPASAWRGSYTVEAALIVSMTIFVLAALILAAFYVHDCAVCQSLACEAAVAGSNFAADEERSAAVSAVKKRIKTSRFLGSRSLTGNASVGQESVVSSWKAAFPVPGFAMKYFANNQLTVKGEWTSKIVNPTGTIRLIRSAGKLITGGDT